jgi:hypothetical protein
MSQTNGQQIIITVEFTGQNRSGLSTKSGTPKPYWILGAFAELPGIKYPQAIELFTSDAAQVKAPGKYAVPLIASVKDNRPAFELDLLAAQPVQALPVRAAAQ